MPTSTKNIGLANRKLFLVGVGILPEIHVTAQAVAAIKASESVVYFSDPQLAELMESLGMTNFEVLDYLYKDGGVDDENYNAILEHVLGVLDVCGSVSFLFQGNPGLGVSLVGMFEQASLERCFDLHVVPGISSFDALIIDASCDPLERGTVVIDANRWLLYDHEPNTFLDYFVYHICSVATRKTNYSDPSLDNGLLMLQQKISEHYPKDHVCQIISSTGAGRESSDIVEVKVADLASAIPIVRFSSTLFIPYLADPKMDQRVLDLIFNGE